MANLGKRLPTNVNGDSFRLSPDFTAIPTFGHTQGHCVLLYKDHVLFTGDHLWWSRTRNSLSSSKEVCWDSWEDQIASMEKLRQVVFEWIMPGHGDRVNLPPGAGQREVAALIDRMKAVQ